MAKESDLVSYDGYLITSPISAEIKHRLQTLAESHGLFLDVGEKGLEFKYSGRDTSRFVVQFLKSVATLLESADGEIVCELTLDDADPLFEFYRVSNRRLTRQCGRITRDPLALVE